MDFIAGRCEVLYFGTLNQGKTFPMNGRTLGSVVEQSELGVRVHSSLKMVSQIDKGLH